MKKWWQMTNSIRGIQEVFEYLEDENDSNVLRYNACLFEFLHTPRDELFLKAAIRGDVAFFRTTPNVVQNVILKKNITVLDA